MNSTENSCFSIVRPTPVRDPKCLAWSTDLGESLKFPQPICSSTVTSLLAGNLILPEMKPYAACYGGHQFGNWAGQLGDGRAITLGEVKNSRDEKMEVQLKGAGTTPYSRGADGRAVLRSSLREFVVSEAMHHLGVPTTRALCLMSTGEQVERDMFYDGNWQLEPGAIVTRIAPTFVRFGNFEIHASRGHYDILKNLTDWVVRNHFPELGELNKKTYINLFHECCRRTAVMIAHWLRVGFVHGVMNSDNMSILGLTIDYGPYGFLDNYDPDWTPNTTDLPGRRYAFGQQPLVGHWNLDRLGDALHPLIKDMDALDEGLKIYKQEIERTHLQMMANKLGLQQLTAEHDHELLNGLNRSLQSINADMTLFFRLLANVNLQQSSAENLKILQPAFYKPLTKSAHDEISDWLQLYQQRSIQETNPERVTVMNQTNPKYIFRNYMAQLAIDAAEQGDLSVLENMMTLLKKPYNEQPEHEKWFSLRPEWARTRPGCSALSCSS